MNKVTFVSYVSEEEVIVCTKETEMQTIKEFFEESGRDIGEYDRIVDKNTGVSFSPVMHKN